MVLSNVFLHYVLDEWFAEQVQPGLRNGSVLVRYCDDFVMLFASKDDAERVQAVLGKRLAKFGLELNPTKTRLVDFRPPAERAGAETTLPTTFTFLGFLHIWSKKRNGKATVWQRCSE
jgi:RNA-directed DNA polymerase